MTTSHPLSSRSAHAVLPHAPVRCWKGVGRVVVLLLVVGFAVPSELQIAFPSLFHNPEKACETNGAEQLHEVDAETDQGTANLLSAWPDQDPLISIIGRNENYLLAVQLELQSGRQLRGPPTALACVL